MTEIEFYIIVGGLFFVAYLFGWLDEQRAITKRIEKQRTANFDWIMSEEGRKVINSFAKNRS